MNRHVSDFAKSESDLSSLSESEISFKSESGMSLGSEREMSSKSERKMRSKPEKEAKAVEIRVKPHPSNPRDSKSCLESHSRRSPAKEQDLLRLLEVTSTGEGSNWSEVLLRFRELHPTPPRSMRALSSMGSNIMRTFEGRNGRGRQLGGGEKLMKECDMFAVRHTCASGSGVVKRRTPPRGNRRSCFGVNGEPEGSCLKTPFAADDDDDDEGYQGPPQDEIFGDQESRAIKKEAGERRRTKRELADGRSDRR